MYLLACNLEPQMHLYNITNLIQFLDIPKTKIPRNKIPTDINPMNTIPKQNQSLSFTKNNPKQPIFIKLFMNARIISFFYLEVGSVKIVNFLLKMGLSSKVIYWYLVIQTLPLRHCFVLNLALIDYFLPNSWY